MTSGAAVNGQASHSNGRGRIPVLYLAPWVDFGGSDKGTIDWFRWLDRDRYAPSLITTQPSENRRLSEVYPFAEEVWSLPDHFAGEDFPRFIFDFIHTRRVQILHIMNSRIGFELLPDLAALSAPPRVVVQLHVEEPDRSGYVRYVTCRYGNLVDGFSVTSEHLARAVERYEVPRGRIHVIPTGVDAEGQCNPDRVQPVDVGSESSTFRILFAGRLVDQKDPMLMLEVIRRVTSLHDDVRVDVVGDGPLEPQVRRRIDELGLGRFIALHPASAELIGWLRASDLLLMTSVFEGVPYVIYEALSMRLPVVAPALPGNVELMRDTGGILVSPRDDPDVYAEAICSLIDDPALRASLAQSGRRRMLESFSLREMAAGHEALYWDLLKPTRARPQAPWSAPERRAPITFDARPASGTPLVSIVTPCFNHGRYLGGFLDAIEAQDYPELEVIIVDDGSTDPQTLEIIDRIAKQGRATVIRQKRNRGPSVARNRAIAAATGRYILPVDADNLLLAGAVRSLVNQLQAAGEQVGYIYPSFQYFGTRDYEFEPPAYNLFLLLNRNFVDTCSLLDRKIFDSQLEYAEDIELGHEDWDLALALGARGVIGEPSKAPVMLYRKQGFTRSDLVEYHRRPFSQEIQHRHPELFGAIDVKARWNPGLSIIALDPIDFESESGSHLIRYLAAQSCRDFELIAECPRVPPGVQIAVRRVPPELCSCESARAQEGLDIRRGRYLMLTSAPSKLFADPTAVEKLLRGFALQDELDAVALADFGAAGRYPFCRIGNVPAATEAHTIAWRQELHEQLPAEATIPTGRPAAELAEFIYAYGSKVQWRHFPGSGPRRATEHHSELALSRPAVATSEAARTERELRFKQPPALPAAPADCVPRWNSLPTWMPPESIFLVRHRAVGGERRVVTNERLSPPGFTIEFDLGSIQHFSPPGTVRLVFRDGQFTTAPRGTDPESGDIVLGYLEQAPLPLFVGLLTMTLPDGSQTLVLASERDPLHAMAASGTFLGFIEPLPIEPHRQPAPSAVIAPSLIRRVDRTARRHRYLVAESDEELRDPSAPSSELGVPLGRDGPGRIALWIDDRGWLGTGDEAMAPPAPSLSRALRWAGAPVIWHDLGDARARELAVARRLWDVAARGGVNLSRPRSRRPRRSGAAPQRRVLGYLDRGPGPGRIELFAATHPVVEDQFVTPYAIEATDMGYERVRSLGFIQARAPLTGQLGGRTVAIPWVSRFGLSARRG